MIFSICMILKVSACCSKRSSTRNSVPAIRLIFFFTASMSLPSFKRSSNADTMPCWANRLRAKPMGAMI